MAAIPLTSRSTDSGGRTMVIPFVMAKDRGAICQSETQVCVKFLWNSRSVRAPPLAQFSNTTSGYFRRRFLYIRSTASQ